MTDLQKTLEGAVAEARSIFAVDSPVINFIVGLLVAYVVIYFITFYLGPVLFGLRPYRPWPILARTMHHVARRAAEMNEDEAAELAGKVASAIHSDSFRD